MQPKSARADDVTCRNSLNNVASEYVVVSLADLANITRFCSFLLMSLMLFTLHPPKPPQLTLCACTNIATLAALCCEFNSHTGSSSHDIV